MEQRGGACYLWSFMQRRCRRSSSTGNLLICSKDRWAQDKPQGADVIKLAIQEQNRCGPHQFEVSDCKRRRPSCCQSMMQSGEIGSHHWQTLVMKVTRYAAI